ncbi:MAG: SRPBCC family protein [Planctomycetota bacterium JB042]
MTPRPVIDPNLDLVLERVVDVRPDLVWKAWTTPEHVVKWFTPTPWTTVACEIDLRPGGAFRTVMRSPEGEEHDNVGCFLEVEAPRRLVWTDALMPGWRPAEKPFMTATILIEPEGDGTRYTAIAQHVDAAGREQHEGMGFMDGWGTALDQLVAAARALPEA